MDASLYARFVEEIKKVSEDSRDLRSFLHSSCAIQIKTIDGKTNLFMGVHVFDFEEGGVKVRENKETRIIPLDQIEDNGLELLTPDKMVQIIKIQRSTIKQLISLLKASKNVIDRMRDCVGA